MIEVRDPFFALLRGRVLASGLWVVFLFVFFLANSNSFFLGVAFVKTALAYTSFARAGGVFNHGRCRAESGARSSSKTAFLPGPPSLDWRLGGAARCYPAHESCDLCHPAFEFRNGKRGCPTSVQVPWESALSGSFRGEGSCRRFTVKDFSSSTARWTPYGFCSLSRPTGYRASSSRGEGVGLFSLYLFQRSGCVRRRRVRRPSSVQKGGSLSQRCRVHFPTFRFEGNTSVLCFTPVCVRTLRSDESLGGGLAGAFGGLFGGAVYRSGFERKEGTFKASGCTTRGCWRLRRNAIVASTFSPWPRKS
jgi:hypothetical protein